MAGALVKVIEDEASYFMLSRLSELLEPPASKNHIRCGFRDDAPKRPNIARSVYGAGLKAVVPVLALRCQIIIIHMLEGRFGVLR